MLQVLPQAVVEGDEEEEEEDEPEPVKAATTAGRQAASALEASHHVQAIRLVLHCAVCTWAH